jgi:hypothetical protein
MNFRQRILGVTVIASALIAGCADSGPRLEGEATVDSVFACLQESPLVNEPAIEETSTYFGPIRMIGFDFSESQAIVAIGVTPGDPEQARLDVEALSSDPSISSELAPNNDEVTVSISEGPPRDDELGVIEACTTETS